MHLRIRSIDLMAPGAFCGFVTRQTSGSIRNGVAASDGRIPIAAIATIGADA